MLVGFARHPLGDYTVNLRLEAVWGTFCLWPGLPPAKVV
jgi:hypothetical protein